MNRTCGILYPVFSLPSRFGIGCFSREAYEFVDFLKESGQGAWQVLPIGPTGFGDSPYQPVSSFAGNPYFIDPVMLIEDGLLEWNEVESLDWGSDAEKVDYGKIYNSRSVILHHAYERFKQQGGLSGSDFEKFCSVNQDWLDDYCLYMALKNENHGKSWQDWDKPLKTRESSALKEARIRLSDEMNFYAFQQYQFEMQWNSLHAYAEDQNIHIIGDMPFYVSLDSADAWAHPHVFQMDQDGTPKAVAGTAPDAFSSTGQLWGNPVYDWKQLKKDHYAWWIARMKRNFELFDAVRIDHFHGFSSYYAVPYGDKTAVNGTTEKGPGIDFFNELKKQLGSKEMIAEDLGALTKENQQLLKDTGIPGMKILEYAFTSWDSIYLPFRYEHNSVVYTGTHDNPTVREWIEEISDGERDYTRRYINSMDTDYGKFTWDFIREAYRSVSDLCIIPLQDYLVKGREARLNTPGTAQGNWQWRVEPGFLSHDLAVSIHDLAATYGRIPKENQ